MPRPRRAGPHGSGRAKRFGTAFALVLVLAAQGCGARRDPAPAPDPVVDGRIEEQLRARLATEPSLEAERIRLEVEAARVRLFGSVGGLGAWNCALRNAWLVEGVLGVSDFLIIERGPREVACRAVRGAAGEGAVAAP